MNAIQSFFKTYGAVACGRNGRPDYKTASADALVMHAEADLKAFKAGHTAETKGRLIEIGVELAIRCNLLWMHDKTPAERKYAGILNDLIPTVKCVAEVYDEAAKDPRWIAGN